MIYIFEIILKRANNKGETLNVLAPDAETACIDALRHEEKNFRSTGEVVMVRRILKVDVSYKTPKRKKR